MKIAFLVGNVGSKPVIKTSNGTTFSNFSVAVNDRGKDGERVTEWYRIVAFGALAETLANVDTGDELVIDGTFRQVSYTGKDKVEHCDIEIRARNIQFARRKDRSRSAGSTTAAGAPTDPAAPDEPAEENGAQDANA
jgi:single stranded DNA-binding protein